MKIAVPSNDNLSISSQIFCTKSFKIFTLERGSIINEEYRINASSEYKNDAQDEDQNHQIIYNLLSDCNIVIANNINDTDSKYLQNHDIEVVLTNERIITQAVLDCYNEKLRQESNTCCCP